MPQRKTKWKYAIQYDAYMESIKNDWVFPISYKKFADRLRQKAKRQKKKLSKVIYTTPPPIQQEVKESKTPRLKYFLFCLLWFVFWLVFSFYFYSQKEAKVVGSNSIEKHNTGSVQQEYLTTGSECEWKPSLSTNGSIICRK